MNTKNLKPFDLEKAKAGAAGNGYFMRKEYNSQPQAMDVYQGKTALEYKVVDGVATDSVVIFKTKEERK